jgi:hypothetical protein
MSSDNNNKKRNNSDQADASKKGKQQKIVRVEQDSHGGSQPTNNNNNIRKRKLVDVTDLSKEKDTSHELGANKKVEHSSDDQTEILKHDDGEDGGAKEGNDNSPQNDEHSTHDEDEDLEEGEVNHDDLVYVRRITNNNNNLKVLPVLHPDNYKLTLLERNKLLQFKKKWEEAPKELRSGYDFAQYVMSHLVHSIDLHLKAMNRNEKYGRLIRYRHMKARTLIYLDPERWREWMPEVLSTILIRCISGSDGNSSSQLEEELLKIFPKFNGYSITDISNRFIPKFMENMDILRELYTEDILNVEDENEDYDYDGVTDNIKKRICKFIMSSWLPTWKKKATNSKETRLAQRVEMELRKFPDTVDEEKTTITIIQCARHMQGCAEESKKGGYINESNQNHGGNNGNARNHNNNVTPAAETTTPMGPKADAKPRTPGIQEEMGLLGLKQWNAMHVAAIIMWKPRAV